MAARSKPPKPADETPGDTPADRLRRLLFQPRLLLLAAAVPLAIVLYPLVRGSLPNLSERPQYAVHPADVEVDNLPPWVPANFVARAMERAGLPETMSLLDDDLTAKIAQALDRDPWTSDVRQVRKDASGRITADVEFRRPVAVVSVNDGVYPVDRDGVLLPPEDFSISEIGRFPLVERVASRPNGPAGKTWGDPVVFAAARLAEALHEHWRTFELAAILAPPEPVQELDDATFELATEGGTRIVWGRAPGTGHPGELSVEQKIGRLQKYREDFGGFEQPRGPYLIDIRHWQEISRRPLRAAGRSGTRR